MSLPSATRMPSETPSITSLGRHLVASPYTDDDHLLDLHTLSKENQLLARALVHLNSRRNDYATAPYTESFNWGEVMAELKHLAKEYGHEWQKSTFYIVVFRSQIPPTTKYSELGELDKAAHLEAVKSGGLLKYWFGSPDKEGRNLATCVWRSLQDARLGGTGPAHRRAAAATRSLYKDWRIERHRLTILDSLQKWEIIEWVDDADKDTEPGASG